MYLILRTLYCVQQMLTAVIIFVRCYCCFCHCYCSNTEMAHWIATAERGKRKEVWLTNVDGTKEGLHYMSHTWTTHLYVLSKETVKLCEQYIMQQCLVVGDNVLCAILHVSAQMDTIPSCLPWRMIKRRKAKESVKVGKSLYPVLLPNSRHAWDSFTHTVITLVQNSSIMPRVNIFLKDFIYVKERETDRKRQHKWEER